MSREKIIEIINAIQEGDAPEGRLKGDASLRKDLGLDSLSLAQLTVVIEDRFGVDIFEDSIVDTIDEIRAKIKRGKSR